MSTSGAQESDAAKLSGIRDGVTEQRREQVARLSRSRWQRIVPVCLIGLLLIFGVGAYLTGRNNLQITGWVDHTYEVRLETLRLHGLLYEAQSLQGVYADTKSAEVRDQLQRTLTAIPVSLETLKRLSSDNSSQQTRIQSLTPILDEFVAEIQRRSSAASAISPDPAGSEEFARLQGEMESIFNEIRETEASLLQARQSSRRNEYEQIFLIVGLIFFAAILLLAFYFRLLWDQVRLARASESALQASAASYRLLSAKVLDLQDRERRRVARELHDSVGQYLAVLRMNLGKLGPVGESDTQQSRLHADTMELANHAVTEVRTISYLLHPPMLEDIGLEGAVRWYAEGFAKRSGLDMALNVEDSEERLPRELELALFRTLQESLTNVHRHARATKVEIGLERRDGRVTLSVRDDGKGLSQESLSRFRAGMAGGVGLAGMRERIMEMGGTFEVESNENGTLLRATVPVELSSAALQEFGKLED